MASASEMYQLGRESLENGDPVTAEKLLKDAILQCSEGMDPSPAYFLLAMTQLIQGNFKDGFFNYEFRPRNIDYHNRAEHLSHHGLAQWYGDILKGKSIVVMSEQGIGDNIQFLRFLPILLSISDRVVFWANEPIFDLLQNYHHEKLTITKTHYHPKEDYYVSIDSLPYLLGVDLDTIPDPFSIPTHKIDRSLDGFNVGLCWRGSQTFPKDHLRSIPFKMLKPLLDVDGVYCHSLQKGYRLDEQISEIDEHGIGGCVTLLDTANFIQKLDLVITVDTSIAHLAASLGKPTWLLNRFESEWRWMRNREDSPWYPSMKIFTQPSIGDWASVIEKVRLSLVNR